MSYIKRIKLDITTTTAGTATGTTVDNVTGLVHTVKYNTTTASINTATSTLTIASKLSGQTIINAVTASASFTFLPRQGTHTTTGGAVTFATSANAGNVALFAVGQEVLTYTIANAPASATASITILIA